MRTYKEYYQFGLNEHLDWKSKQTEEWWKNKNDFDYLETKGDYIETIKFLTVDEKNDSSLFQNHTNVKNSEWDILFSMLGQALVDWCVENNVPQNIYSFHLNIDRYIDGLDDCYKVNWGVHTTDDDNKINEPEIFDDCANTLADIVNEFISQQGKNIPNDWNYFSFGLDDLQASIKYGEWVCFSDGYMNLGNLNWEKPEDERYDQFVECM